MRPVVNERVEDPETGSARVKGPHMPAQCKLPTSPRINAVQSSIESKTDHLRRGRDATNHDFLLEEIFLSGDGPDDAEFPQTILQCCGINCLNTRCVRIEFDLLIQSGGGRAI